MVDSKISTQFKPGVSGNPNGRPKGSKSFAGAMKRLMSAQKLDMTWTINGKEKKKKIDITGDYENFYDAIVAKQIEMAIGGDQRAADSIMSRMEGTPTQSINMKQEVSGGLNVTVDKRIINSRSEIKRVTRTVVEDEDIVETIVETVKNIGNFDVDKVF